MSTHPLGRFALTCAHCGLSLGVIAGSEGEQGRRECPRCGWWIEYQWVRQQAHIVVEWVEWAEEGQT